MAQARVSSLEALETFRAQLVVFHEKARLSVDEMSDEVRRTRAWIEGEQRPLWEREIRRRQQLLDLAEQELMTARLSSLRENIQRQQEAVRRGRQAVAEAEEKLRAVKKWTRDFEHVTSPLLRQFQGVRQILDTDFPRGLAFLAQVQNTLAAYAELSAPEPLPPAPSAP